MSTQRISVVLVSSALALTACGTKDKSKDKVDPVAGSAMAGSAMAGSAAASSAAAGSTMPGSAAAGSAAAGSAVAAGDTSTVIPNAKLGVIKLPTPKFGPAKGAWHTADAPQSGDGIRVFEFTEPGVPKEKEDWLLVAFQDCNLPVVKANPKDNKECFEAAPAKYKGFPYFNADSHSRTVKLGHLTVIVSAPDAHNDVVKDSDLEAYLDSLDIPGYAKL